MPLIARALGHVYAGSPARDHLVSCACHSLLGDPANGSDYNARRIFPSADPAPAW